MLTRVHRSRTHDRKRLLVGVGILCGVLNAPLAFAGVFDIGDVSPYAGLAGVRVWHDSESVTPVGLAGAVVGVDAGVGVLGRVGVELNAGVGVVDGDIDGYDPPVSWSFSRLWLGFAYRTPGRVYGKVRTGFCRTWLSLETPGETSDEHDDGGTWAVGAGARVWSDVFIEAEYETIATLYLDNTDDNTLRSIHVALAYRRSGR